MRVVFMGSAEISVMVLSRLLEEPGIDVVGVVTQPDRPQGRRLQVAACPARVYAERAGLAVVAPERIRSAEAQAAIAAWRPDVGVVLAYGQILSAAVLSIPCFGCLNIHTSLLPKYRGASPIQRAVAAGDAVSGVTVIQMDEGMDTGDIVGQRGVAIEDADTAQDLHDRLGRVGADLIVDVLAQLCQGTMKAVPQNHANATMAPRLRKSEGQIDWTQPSRKLYNQVRGFDPWPGSYCTCRTSNGEVMVKIWRVRSESGGSGVPGMLIANESFPVVACGEGALVLELVQPAGGKRMSGCDFLKGRRLECGTICFA